MRFNKVIKVKRIPLLAGAGITGGGLPIPAAPTLTAPADAATLTDRTPDLTWGAVAGATLYRIQISTVSNFASTVVDDATLVTNSYTVGSALALGVYYWRVAGINAGGTQGAWSVTRSFGFGLAPITNRLAEWWAGASVFTDATFTTPAVNGNAVAGWQDQTGTYDLTQTQVAAPDRRPAFAASVASLGNKPALIFATDDALERVLSAPLLANLNVYSIFVVYSGAAVSGEVFAEASTVSDTPFVSFRPSAGGAARTNHRSDGNINASIAPVATGLGTGPFLVTVLRLAANSFAYRLNGTQDGTSALTPGATTTNHLSIGALVRTAYALPYTGQIAYIGLYNVANNFAAVEAVLAAHYGITLP